MASKLLILTVHKLFSSGRASKIFRPTIVALLPLYTSAPPIHLRIVTTSPACGGAERHPITRKARRAILVLEIIIMVSGCCRHLVRLRLLLEVVSVVLLRECNV